MPATKTIYWDDVVNAHPYVVVRARENNQHWDNVGGALEAMDITHWASKYAMAMTESPANSGCFMLDLPAGLPIAAWYVVDIYNNASPAITDKTSNRLGTMIGYLNTSRLEIAGADVSWWKAATAPDNTGDAYNVVKSGGAGDAAAILLGVTGIGVNVATKAEGATMLLGITGINANIASEQATILFGLTGLGANVATKAEGATLVLGITGIRSDIATVQLGNTVLQQLARNRLEFDMAHSIAYKWNDAGTSRLYVTTLTDEFGAALTVTGVTGPINMTRWTSV